MTKILNLDALSASERTLVLGGKEYAVKEMSVENFIETTKAAEALQGRTAPLSEQVEGAVDLIVRSIPDVDVALLRAVPLKHLQTIVGFVRGDEVEKTDEEPAAEGAKPVKPKARK